MWPRTGKDEVWEFVDNNITALLAKVRNVGQREVSTENIKTFTLCYLR